MARGKNKWSWDEERAEAQGAVIVKIGPPSLEKVTPRSKEDQARRVHAENKKAKPKFAYPPWLPGAILSDRGLRFS